MITTIVLILVVIVSVALILGELFYFPGFGLPGILGILGLTGMCTFLFFARDIFQMVALLMLAVVLFIVGFYFLSRSDMMNKISLKKEVDEQVNKIPETLHLGAKGIAKSRMALTGRVDIDGILIEATSEQGFILEETPIYISRLTQDKVFVSIDKNQLAE